MSPRRPSRLLLIVAVAALARTEPASAGRPAVVTRPASPGATSILVLPTPHAGLPEPTLLGVSGLPTPASPHGLAFADSDTVLIADNFNYRLLVVRISTRQLIAEIPIGDPAEPGTANGTGTVAVDPSGRYALVLGNHTCFETGFLTVVHAPFHAGSTVTYAPLPWGCGIPRWQTQGIVFDRTGRAYLWTQLSIRVFDPPYVAEAFNLDLLDNSGGAIAITPSGEQLLTTDASTSGQVSLWTLPLFPTSQPVLLDIAPGEKLDAIGVSPDGTRALVAASDLPQLYSIAAPFTPSSVVEQIPLPSEFSGRGFEDISFRPDGGLAIATGNGFPGEPQPLLILEPPFTAAGAVAHAVSLPGSQGRDEGAARFWPGLFADGFESGDTSEWSAP